MLQVSAIILLTCSKIRASKISCRIYKNYSLDVKGKKGGGLMILYKNNNFLVKIIETIHKHILIIQCQIYSLELRMILVYMSVTNYDGNNILIQYVQEHIENTKNYIILGDLNCYTGFLGPQSMYKNVGVRSH